MLNRRSIILCPAASRKSSRSMCDYLPSKSTRSQLKADIESLPLADESKRGETATQVDRRADAAFRQSMNTLLYGSLLDENGLKADIVKAAEHEYELSKDSIHKRNSINQEVTAFGDMCKLRSLTDKANELLLEDVSLERVGNELQSLFVRLAVSKGALTTSEDASFGDTVTPIALPGSRDVVDAMKRRERERHQSVALSRRIEADVTSVEERLEAGMRLADVLIQLQETEAASRASSLDTSCVERTLAPFFRCFPDLRMSDVDDCTLDTLTARAKVNSTVVSGTKSSSTRLLSAIRSAQDDATFTASHSSVLNACLASICEAKRKNRFLNSLARNSYDADTSRSRSGSWTSGRGTLPIDRTSIRSMMPMTRNGSFQVAVSKRDYASACDCTVIVHRGAPRYRHDTLQRIQRKFNKPCYVADCINLLEARQNSRGDANCNTTVGTSGSGELIGYGQLETTYTVSPRVSSPYARLAEPIRLGVLSAIGHCSRRSGKTRRGSSWTSPKCYVRVLLNVEKCVRKARMSLNREFHNRSLSRLCLRCTPRNTRQAQEFEPLFQMVLQQVSSGVRMTLREACAVACSLHAYWNLRAKMHQQLLYGVHLRSVTPPIYATFRGKRAAIHPDTLAKFLPLLQYKTEDNDNEITFRWYLATKLTGGSTQELQRTKFVDSRLRHSFNSLQNLELDRCTRLNYMQLEEIENFFAKCELALTQKADAHGLFKMLVLLRLPSERRQHGENDSEFCETKIKQVFVAENSDSSID